MPTGTGILERALKHIGERYEHVLAPKNDPNWRGPWDCSEFVSWCVFQEAGLLYGCDDDHGSPAIAKAYTGYWERDAAAFDDKISVKEASGIAGAVVLRYPPAGGGMGHVVISDGTGGTVEAKGTNYGVVRDTLSNRRWDTGIRISAGGIIYNAAIQVPLAGPADPVYYVGMPDMDPDKVIEIQTALGNAGYKLPKIDGYYGPLTAAAVQDFQAANGLVVDGETGPLTWAKLKPFLTAPAPPPQPVNIPTATAVNALQSTLLAGDPALAAIVAGNPPLCRKVPSCLEPGVATVQAALNQLAARYPEVKVDLSGGAQGYFGPNTQKAVVAFQAMKGLTQAENGTVGRQTLFALDLELLGGPSAVQTPAAPQQQTAANPGAQGSTAVTIVPHKGPPVGLLNERYKRTVRSVEVYQLALRPGYFYQANMAIDVDGSPRAYAPADAPEELRRQALDDLSNADSEGSSTTYIQGKVNPKTGRKGIGPGMYDGMYVSGTSLRFDPRVYWRTDNFLDAEQIPFIVFPPHFHDAGLGDLAYVVSLRNFRTTAAICGDCGAEGRVGEASLRTAVNLGRNDLSASDGEDDDVFLYIVFPQTHYPPDPAPPHWTEKKIRQLADKCFQDWGGLEQVKALYRQIT
jgi:peptidoglycan hydrolase-like protein with peptidoglycan-binding domain